VTMLGYIILNKNYYSKNKKEPNEIINHIEINKCFIFNNELLDKARTYLSIVDQTSKDFFNVSTFVFLMLFCTFMKVHLAMYNIEYIKTIEFLDKNTQEHTLVTPFFKKSYFFHYVIFYFSLVFSITTMYYTFLNFNFDDCFSFNNYSFESFSYDRTFISDIITKEYPSPNILAKYKDDNLIKQDIYENFMYFQRNHWFIIKNQVNSWRFILFLCSMIWSCRYFEVFDDEMNVAIIPEKKTYKFHEKLIFSLSIFLVIGNILYGFLKFIDEFYLRFAYAYYDLDRTFEANNLFFILSAIFHVILYAIIMVYSIRNKVTLIYQRENRVMESKLSSRLIIPKLSLPKSGTSRFLGSTVNVTEKAGINNNEEELGVEIHARYFDFGKKYDDKSSSMNNNINTSSFPKKDNSIFLQNN
jgi:hypothetical protein